MCAFLNCKTTPGVLLLDLVDLAKVALAQQPDLVEALLKTLEFERALLALAAATVAKGQV